MGPTPTSEPTRAPAPLPPLRVVAAVIAMPSLRPGGVSTRLLVQQRRPGGPRGLSWEFPGGKVEPGESEPAAVARECAEELGHPVVVGALLWRVVHPYPDRPIALAVYAARWPPRAPPPRRLAARRLAWVAAARLGDLAFCPADAPLVRRLAAGTLTLPVA